jgi:O-antigen/teichoic acid export membrane protein
MQLGRVVNNSVALLLLDLVNKLVPWVVFPWVVRALGPAVYGRLGFAGAVAGFFGLVASPGFTTYALREAARDPAKVPFLVRHVLGARVVFAVTAFFLLAIFTLFFAPKDSQTRTLILLSGLAFVIASLDIQWVFAARSRMWIIAARGALSQVAYAGLILALVRGSGDAWVVPAAALLSSALTTLLLWLPARHQYHIPLPSIAPRTWGMFLPISLTIGFASLMSMIYDQIDTVMLKYFRSDSEVGVYVAAYSLMAAAMSFPPILAQVFGPLLSESAGQDPDSEARYLHWLGHAMVGLALPIAIGGFILAGPMTAWVLGRQYPSSGVLFRWLMLTVVTGSLASYFGAQLIPNGRERRYVVAVAWGATSNIVLNLFLIPRYGAIAAALTTAFSQSIVAALNYYFARDLPRSSLLAPLVLSLPASCLMAIGLIAIQTVWAPHVIVLITCGAVFYMGAYVISMRLRNRVPLSGT